MTIGRTSPAAALAAILAMMTSACAVTSPLAIDSTGDGITSAGKVALAVSNDEKSERRARFAGALGEAFADRSIPVAADGGYVADYAISLGEAADGVVRGEAKAGTEPDWLATPRSAGRFDKCDAQRMRGTLVLFDRASGEVIYRGSASRIECGFDDGDIDAMADALVADALKAI